MFDLDILLNPRLQGELAMPRPPRIQFPGAIYHVITRADGRRTLFHDQEHYDRFTKGLAGQKKGQEPFWLIGLFEDAIIWGNFMDSRSFCYASSSTRGCCRWAKKGSATVFLFVNLYSEKDFRIPCRRAQCAWGPAPKPPRFSEAWRGCSM